MYKIILDLDWYTIYQLLMSIPSLDISISFTFFLSFYLLMFAFCKVSTNNIKSKNFALPPDVLCTKVHTSWQYTCVGYFSKVIFGENLVASMLCRWLCSVYVVLQTTTTSVLCNALAKSGGKKIGVTSF